MDGIAWHPDGRAVAFAADRGPEPDLRPRTTIWAVDVDAKAGRAMPEPREILAGGGSVVSPAWSPDGRWLAAIGVLETEPLDDISPTVLVGPADGSRPAWKLAPELDRPAANWADTDLTGWMVAGRHGPFWLDDATIVATVTDRGRSFPMQFRLDSQTGAPADPPRHAPRRHARPVVGVGDGGHRRVPNRRRGRARHARRPGDGADDAR